VEPAGGGSWAPPEQPGRGERFAPPSPAEPDALARGDWHDAGALPSRAQRFAQPPPAGADPWAPPQAPPERWESPPAERPPPDPWSQQGQQEQLDPWRPLRPRDEPARDAAWPGAGAPDEADPWAQERAAASQAAQPGPWAAAPEGAAADAGRSGRWQMDAQARREQPGMAAAGVDGPAAPPGTPPGTDLRNGSVPPPAKEADPWAAPPQGQWSSRQQAAAPPPAATSAPTRQRPAQQPEQPERPAPRQPDAQPGAREPWAAAPAGEAEVDPWAQDQGGWALPEDRPRSRVGKAVWVAIGVVVLVAAVVLGVSLARGNKRPTENVAQPSATRPAPTKTTAAGKAGQAGKGTLAFTFTTPASWHDSTAEARANLTVNGRVEKAIAGASSLVPSTIVITSSTNTSGLPTESAEPSSEDLGTLLKNATEQDPGATEVDDPETGMIDGANSASVDYRGRYRGIDVSGRRVLTYHNGKVYVVTLETSRPQFQHDLVPFQSVLDSWHWTA